MNLQKLFEMQDGFDARVLTSKGFTREETFEFRILAFIDEVAECMKEWRVFKFWSNDREPRTEVPTGEIKILSDGFEIEICKNPLLEEYVDGLHFAISLCIDLEVKMTFPASIKCDDATEQFFELYSLAVELKKEPSEDKADYLLAHYLGLGELLGFALEEIEQAYIQKNEVNHQRQDNGY